MRHLVIDPKEDITAYELAKLICIVQSPGSTLDLIRDRLKHQCPDAKLEEIAASRNSVEVYNP